MVPEQVRWKERVAYGAGDLASCLYWNTFSLFLLFFYTDTFGISPAAAGTMLLITRTVDAVFDPLMGMIGDRTRSRWGRFRPWLLWMCVPFAIAGVLTFTTPNLSPTGKLIYAYITYALVMIFYSAINIPYGALLGVITPDSDERTRLSTYRFFGAFAGNLIVQGTLLYLVAGFGSGNWGFGNVAAIEHLKLGKRLSAPEVAITQHGFPLAVGVYAILAAALFLFTFAATKERVHTLKRHSSSVREDLRDVLHNRPWLVLSAANVLFLIWVSMRGAATAYYFKYYVGNSQLMSSWLVFGTIATLLGVAATEPLTRWLGGRRSTYIWLQLINAASCGLLFFASPSNYILIFGTQIIGSFLNGPLNPLIWAMYADTADYAEWRFGRPSTGLILSAGTFSQKTGWTVGGAVAGWLLAYYGFAADKMQSTATLNGIRMMMSLLPAAASIVTAIAALFYNLDRRTQQRIEAELKERRAAPPVAMG
ncbi:MAG: MFS transporter [Bryobacteraceae bacterium]|jgi:GPH family glycoside/pentoside/hexuronide:cation symporter